MNQSQTRSITFAKVLVVCAVALGVGIGLCGLSYVLPSSDDEFHTNWLSLPSLLLMGLSALGLIITAASWVITAAIGDLSVKNSGPQTLFGNSDEGSKDRDKTP